MLRSRKRARMRSSQPQKASLNIVLAVMKVRGMMAHSALRDLWVSVSGCHFPNQSEMFSSVVGLGADSVSGVAGSAGSLPKGSTKGSAVS